MAKERFTQKCEFYSCRKEVKIVIDSKERRCVAISVARFFQHLFLGLVISTLFSMALTALPSQSLSEETVSPSKGKAEETQAKEKVYVNEKFGYVVTYPSNWFPSGITYANAFEIRNYDPKNPQSVPEKNRASVVIVDTLNDDKDTTGKFLSSLRVGESTPENEHRPLVVDGHRAVKVIRKEKAQRLGRGPSRALKSPGSPQPEAQIFLISLYVEDDKHLISIEGTVSAEADVSVPEEMNRIEGSLKFKEIGSGK
jgi:hypothetical protein